MRVTTKGIGLSLIFDTHTWSSYCSMIQRTQVGFGSRGSYLGMQVEEDWLLSFGAFLADLGPRPEGKSLDRIDVQKGYVRGNCRWASPSQQARNKTNTLYVFYRGEEYVLIDLCEFLNKDYEIVRGRLKVGMDIESALDNPKRHSWTKINVDGKDMTLREYCELKGADYDLTRNRLRFGWELANAVSLPKGSRKPIRDYE